MLTLHEPAFGVTIIQALNARAGLTPSRFHIVSLLADLLVFIYPIFLVLVYIHSMAKRDRPMKEYSLRIAASAALAFCINIFLQLFLYKIRPETALASSHGMLLQHLPSMSFPSDHAAVSIAFAYAVMYFACIMIIAPTHLMKKLFQRGMCLWVGGIVMSISRIAVGVHWPTDIFAGWLVGIGAVALVGYMPSKRFAPVIHFQEYLWRGILRFFWKLWSPR
jgi:undecaprenyl-diphosphatase